MLPQPTCGEAKPFLKKESYFCTPKNVLLSRGIGQGRVGVLAMAVGTGWSVIRFAMSFKLCCVVSEKNCNFAMD